MARKRAALLHHPPERKRGPRISAAKNPRVAAPASHASAGALYRLMTWLSPSYPVSAFSYSSGLEWLVEAGDVTNAQTLARWLTSLLSDGAGSCDAVFFVHAHRAAASGDDPGLIAVAELAGALTSSRERFLETTAQGRAFFEITSATWPCPALDRLSAIWSGPLAYPVAVAVAAAGHDVPLDQSLAAFLHALVANWVSAAVRLVPLGQTDGQRVIAMLEPAVSATVASATTSALEDAASATFRADIAAMRHETQYTRLFRS
jgi:urease accessory protein